MRDRKPSEPECPVCGRIAYSIDEYSRALGISVRTARNQLRAGDLDGGVVRVGDRVLILRQFLRDRIDLALGIDPDPERDEDEIANAEEEARAARAREPELARQRAAYALMCQARGDDGGSGETIYR